MELYVLDKDKKRIAVIDDYKSLIWAKRYTTYGDCELYVRATEENFKNLVVGNFLARYDDRDMVCRIEDVKLETDVENGDFLIITGYDVRKILNQRIILNTISFKGQAKDFILKILQQNVVNPTDSARKINRVVAPQINIMVPTDHWEEQTTYDYVFDKIVEISEKTGCGSKMRLMDYGDYGVFSFSMYKGSEKPYVVFSPEYDNISSTTYEYNKSDVKNVAVVGGSGEGRDRVVAVTGNSADLSRYEIFVDAKDISREIEYSVLTDSYPNGTIVTETVDDQPVAYYVYNGEKIAVLDSATEPTKATLELDIYKTLLRSKGEEVVAENKAKISFEGNVDTLTQFVYKEDFDLGDVVTIQNEYGIGASARIVEIIETFDDNGHTVSPTFEYTEEVEEEVQGVILTESKADMITEQGEYLVLEEYASESSVASKKISELDEADSITDGSCFPLVTFGETKKISYGTLKEELIDEATNYNNLGNKPKINGVELTGNKSFDDLGLSEMDEIDILAILD